MRTSLTCVNKISLVYFGLYYLQNVTCDMISKSDVESILLESPTNKSVNRNKLSGRSGKRSKPLPGSIFRGNSASEVTCGGTYDVSTDGPKYFHMNSKDSSCYLAFLGSAMAGCKVGVLCDGVVNLAPASPNASFCDREYLKLFDSTEGLMEGCGEFSFNQKPRFSRNHGADIYVSYKGAVPNECVALCVEDISTEQNLRPAKKISANKYFHGLHINQNCICGKRRDFGRVVGGKDATRFEFPWIGAIVFKGHSEYAREPFCAGSLINDRYVISAAHCFASTRRHRAVDIQVLLHVHVVDRTLRNGMQPNDPLLQFVPGWDLPRETDESEESIRLDVEELLIHPKFNMTTFDWDVAILKLKPTVSFRSQKVSPICLPQVGEVIPYQDREKLVLAGWGLPGERIPVSSRVLQKVDIEYVNHAKCEEYTLPSMRHLCAGAVEGGKDGCAGDSGGPLIYKFKPDNNQYILSGIVSAGEGCARAGRVGLYTNTSEIVQWVYHHTSDASWCKRGS